MANFVTPCNTFVTPLCYKKMANLLGFWPQGPGKPIKIKIPKIKKFFSNRCKMVLQCYNQLEALVLLNNSVTLGCYKGVTGVTNSLREEDFYYI